MIDESIMEKIIPLPDEDEEMEKVQGELEGEGFPIHRCFSANSSGLQRV